MSARQHRWRRLCNLAAGWLVVALALVVPLGQAPSAAADDRPQALVAALNGTLLEVMQEAEVLGYQGRFDRLAPALEQSFDFATMIRLAVGRGWRDFAPEERAQLTALFTEMSIANFAARFDGYSGERFEIVAESPAPRDTILVETQLVRPKADPVALNYVLREADDAWRIIDVWLDAKFSELARQRAEFGAIVRDGGAAALAATLTAKIEELAGSG